MWSLLSKPLYISMRRRKIELLSTQSNKKSVNLGTLPDPASFWFLSPNTLWKTSLSICLHMEDVNRRLSPRYMLLTIWESSCSHKWRQRSCGFGMAFFSHGAGSSLEPIGAYNATLWPWMIKGYLHGNMCRAVVYIPFAEEHGKVKNVYGNVKDL